MNRPIRPSRPGRTADRDREFREYVAARTGAVRRTAYMLCGDWHEAEDLAQSAFVKLYLAWNRVDRQESLDAYVRTIVVRTFVAERRRFWRRREHLTATVVDVPATGEDHEATEQRTVLWAALAAVPRRQRAALVLRYWEDMSIEDTARVLGCSEGTVKSQCARGLRTLRTVLEADPAADRARLRRGA